MFHEKCLKSIYILIRIQRIVWNKTELYEIKATSFGFDDKEWKVGVLIRSS